MRDYDEIPNIQNLEDIDVVIHLEDRKKVLELLRIQGWVTPKYNLNFYGHKQFFKWDGSKVIKLDILFGIVFGNGSYELRDQDSIFKNAIIHDNVKIPNYEDGLLIHICHILLDKKTLSEKNRRFLNYLCDKVVIESRPELHRYASQICDFSQNESQGSMVNDMLSRGLLSCTSNIGRKLLWIIKKFFSRLVSKDSIKVAVIGVDGSGKSTSVDALNKYYEGDVFTQYFGFRQYESNIAKKRFANYRYIPVVSYLIDCFVSPYEMMYRYKKAKRTGKRILIFDRYPWEAYDNAQGFFAKAITFIIYKSLFKRPDGIIYLYCPVEVSLNRKDDILDVEYFKKMKMRFDSIYLNMEGVLKIDTSIHNRQEVSLMSIEYVSLLNSTL